MSVGIGRGRWFSNMDDGAKSGFAVGNNQEACDLKKQDASTADESGWDDSPSSGPANEWQENDVNKESGGSWNSGQDRGGQGRGGRSGYQNRDGNYGGFRGGYRNRDEGGGGGRGGYRNNRDENGGAGYRNSRDEDGGGDRGGYRNNRDDNGGGGRGGYRNNRGEYGGGGRGFRSNGVENGGGGHGFRSNGDENGGGGRGGYRNYRDEEGGGGRGGYRNRDGNESWTGDSSTQSWSNKENQHNGERSFRGRGGGYRNRDDNNAHSEGNQYDGESTDRNWGGADGGDGDQGGRGGRGRGRGRGRGGFQRGGGHGNDDDNNSGGGFRPKNGGEGEESDRPKVPHYIPPERSEEEEKLYESIPSGINFSKYADIPVNMTGSNAPAKINSFEESGLRALLKKNVSKSGYTVPTPVQKYAIPAIMADRDLMACAQTGSGKTAAFLLPIIHNLMEANVESGSFQQTQEPYALVVTPTRELTQQICREAHKFAHDSVIKAVELYGGVSLGHQLSKLEKGCHICIATPGRLLDVLDRGKISFAHLQYLVLDEADRMLDMGFKSTIERIVGHHTMQPKENRRTLMFSATFPEDIQKMAKEFLDNYLFLTVGMVGGANSDVSQEIVLVQPFEKREKLLEIIKGGDRILVFIEQKRHADFVTSIICQSPGLSATSIHGDRFQAQREEALWDFKTGNRKVLVATSVASRGLDIKDVKMVVNYDMPKCIDEYVHRIGRTGRVGNIGRAVSFYNPETDKDIARPLIKILTDANQEVPAWLEEEARSSGAGGGGYSRGRFGGRDIRDNREIRGNSGPPEVDQWDNDQGVKETETWD